MWYCLLCSRCEHQVVCVIVSFCGVCFFFCLSFSCFFCLLPKTRDGVALATAFGQLSFFLFFFLSFLPQNFLFYFYFCERPKKILVKSFLLLYFVKRTKKTFIYNNGNQVPLEGVACKPIIVSRWSRDQKAVDNSLVFVF